MAHDVERLERMTPEVTGYGSSQRPYGLLGIGLGPANLSLAALITNSDSIPTTLSGACVFLERNSRFEWHPGQLFPGSLMQTSFVRDLVTIADPSNRLSFLSYLKAHRRLLQFLNGGWYLPSREEFVAYMQWVASRTSNIIRFDAHVTSIEFDSELSTFVVSYDEDASSGRLFANALVIGTGGAPINPWRHVPNCISVNDYLRDDRQVGGKKVVVVGGGQSAGEFMSYLLSANDPPSEVIWLNADSNFAALETGNFSRELYTPSYARSFYHSSVEHRKWLLDREHRAESGISPALLETIYRQLYLARHVRSFPKVRVVPEARVIGVNSVGVHCSIDFAGDDAEPDRLLDVDLVVVCIGFARRHSELLKPFGVTERSFEQLSEDYRLDWGGPRERPIYVQSAARNTHGIGDENLSVICWRNSIIVNSLCNREVLEVDWDDAIADWH